MIMTNHYYFLLPTHTHTHTHPHTHTVNTKYESVDAINEQFKTNTVESTQEHDFDNPLYDTGKADNDYSSPWDTRVDGSTEPMVVSSTNSTHAVVMRVNSNEHSSTHQVEYATIDLKRVEYAAIDPKRVENATIEPNPKRRRSYENTKLTSLSLSSHDYAEPPNALPPTESQPVYDTPELPPTESQPVYDTPELPPTESQPVYDTPELPPTESQPVYDTPELPPTHSYEYAELATTQRPSTADGGRSFDNTGEDGLYRSSSPMHLPPEAELHYDLGQ